MHLGKSLSKSHFSHLKSRFYDYRTCNVGVQVKLHNYEKAFNRCSFSLQLFNHREKDTCNSIGHRGHGFLTTVGVRKLVAA